MEPVIIYDSVNPSGTLRAIVEETPETVYLYIQPHPSLEQQYGMRAAWVRNLKPAPDAVDFEAMEGGEAPMLPKENCAHPEGAPAFDREQLELVWSRAEDGATLYYQNEIIAIVPGWSLYLEQPVSYAKDCIKATEAVFPIERGNALLEAATADKAFLYTWSGETSPWPAIQDYLLSSYEKVFGKHEQYFSIDGGEWPPMAIASFRYKEVYLFLSIGASQRPMPWVDHLYPDTASGYRRMEIGVAAHESLGDAVAMELAQGIAGLAGMPWRKITWLGEGHTISSDAVKQPYESLILSSALYNGPQLPDLQIEGDKVNIYWAQPITLAEREFAHSKANGGYELIEKMIHKDINWIVHPDREIVV